MGNIKQFADFLNEDKDERMARREERKKNRLEKKEDKKSEKALAKDIKNNPNPVSSPTDNKPFVGPPTPEDAEKEKAEVAARNKAALPDEAELRSKMRPEMADEDTLAKDMKRVAYLSYRSENGGLTKGGTAEVAAFQKKMNEAGASPELEEDGAWGPLTQAAWVEYVANKKKSNGSSTKRYSSNTSAAATSTDSSDADVSSSSSSSATETSNLKDSFGKTSQEVWDSMDVDVATDDKGVKYKLDSDNGTMIYADGKQTKVGKGDVSYWFKPAGDAAAKNGTSVTAPKTSSSSAAKGGISTSRADKLSAEIKVREEAYNKLPLLMKTQAKADEINKLKSDLQLYLK